MRSGGSYDNRDGKMKKVAQTQPHPEGNRPRNAKGEPIDLPVETQSVESTPKPKTRKKAVRKQS
ncbi:MAG: hypothetical protein KZQ94_21295 [Candidatus Thiodiazotropha sp. (ex Troendleina suluensis)]|nr:hypothetical protein [Candidatus Thiodiazotropha sp. (ex Troendleina suluensis)]